MKKEFLNYLYTRPTSPPTTLKMERQNSIFASADICSSTRPTKGDCVSDIQKPFSEHRRVAKDAIREKYDLMKPLKDSGAWKK